MTTTNGSANVQGGMPIVSTIALAAPLLAVFGVFVAGRTW
jgi:hypothetical protein